MSPWHRIRAVLGSLLVGAIVVTLIYVLVSLKEYEDSQLDNRVKNVGTWCGYDVSVKAALEQYVGAIPHAPALKLPPLNCKTLEHKTEASAK
jgi:hypothetical protein